VSRHAYLGRLTGGDVSMIVFGDLEERALQLARHRTTVRRIVRCPNVWRRRCGVVPSKPAIAACCDAARALPPAAGMLLLTSVFFREPSSTFEATATVGSILAPLYVPAIVALLLQRGGPK